MKKDFSKRLLEAEGTLFDFDEANLLSDAIGSQQEDQKRIL